MWLLLLAVLVFAPAEAATEARQGWLIAEILVSGNQRSREDFVIDSAAIRPGQRLGSGQLAAARQRLLDTGLYKSVEMNIESAPDGKWRLFILLVERRSWILLPRINRNVDGDVKFGLRLRMYNLAGAGRRLQVLAQRERRDDGDSIDEWRVGYDVPLKSRNLELQFRLGHAEKSTEVDDFDNREVADTAGFGVARTWLLDEDDASLRLSLRATFEEQRHQRRYPESVDARDPGSYNRLRLALAYDASHIDRYRRFGHFHEISLAQGADWLGTDYRSTFLGMESILYHPLNAYDNLNFRIKLGLSNDSPFNIPRFEIGGGSTLRGLEDFDERGDAVVYANVEYLVSYRRAPQFRHSLFVDVGNIYEDFESIDLGDQRYTLGTGFRWKIESFVETDLFIDYGYDVEGGQGKLYGGTSLNF